MWGLMADVDFQSEKYRKPFGSNRFIISALKNVSTLRTYKGSAEILCAEKNEWIKIDGPFVNVIARYVTYICDIYNI